MLQNDPLTISVADWRIALYLENCDTAVRTKFISWYSAFIVPQQAGSIAIRVAVQPGDLFIPFEGSTSWQIRTAKTDSRIDFESHQEKGWVDLKSGQGEIVLRPGGNIENFLRVLYAWLCFNARSLLLHSCGIVRNGLGYVFFGPSGSGKTTTARLSSEHTILSDDLVIIKKMGKDYHAFGVPFRGDLPEAPRSNASAKLVGLFTLVKDTRNYLEPVSISQATAQLVQCVPFVITSPLHALQVTEICADFAARVPVRAMHFRRDENFWELMS